MRKSVVKPAAQAWLLWAASLAVGPANAIDGLTIGPEKAPVVTLFTKCDSEASANALKEMREEVEESLEPAGFLFDWRELDLSRAIEPVTSLVVIRLRGTCRTQFSGVRPGVQGPLGRTHVSEGEVLPFCEVNCDRVRDFISSCANQRPEDERERAFGRALGRVLAHELYHVLANTREHNVRGLAKALLEPLELVGEACDFESEDLRKMRRGPRTQMGQESPPGEQPAK